MARKHYWQFLVSDEGNPIENAQVTVYFAGTEDPAWVYTDSVGSAGSGDMYQINTSLKGFFEFWVPDETEPNGHPISTKFKIAWVANGVSDGYVDDIDVFSTFIEEVDITSVDTLRNKAVSNFLAKGWEDHKNAIYPGANVHGITGVDVDLALPVGDDIVTDGDLSKLLSNYLGRTWETHTRTLWDDTVDITNIPDTVHGIDTVDETDAVDTGTPKNKLVSNTLAKSWTDHLSDATDPHPQYMPIAGDTGTYPNNFTGEVGYSWNAVFSEIGTNDFITKSMLNEFTYGYTITQGEWSDNSDGTYSFTVNHNLGVSYPIVVLWEIVDGGIVVQPEEIRRLNDHNTVITVSDITNQFWVRIWYQNDAIPPL